MLSLEKYRHHSWSRDVRAIRIETGRYYASRISEFSRPRHKIRMDRANRDVFRKTLTDFAVFEMIILDDLQRGGTFTNVEDVVEHARTAE